MTQNFESGVEDPSCWKVVLVLSCDGGCFRSMSCCTVVEQSRMRWQSSCCGWVFWIVVSQKPTRKFLCGLGSQTVEKVKCVVVFGIKPVIFGGEKKSQQNVILIITSVTNVKYDRVPSKQ